MSGKSSSDTDWRALEYMDRMNGPVEMWSFPQTITPAKLADLAGRGLLKIDVRLTEKGKQLVEEQRLHRDFAGLIKKQIKLKKQEDQRAAKAVKDLSGESQQ